MAILVPKSTVLFPLASLSFVLLDTLLLGRRIRRHNIGSLLIFPPNSGVSAAHNEQRVSRRDVMGAQSG